ncbi:MAG: oxidoreductase [Planctomycetaceae bacterium]|nr:oxidoreductase [Planctomycetaceae bacterium]
MDAIVSKTIVLTGATRGLGRALVDGFVNQGHTVVGCGRSAPAVDDLSSQFSDPHRFDVIDVSNDDQVRGWCESLISSHGTPDLVINNAALINQNAPLWEVPVEEFSDVIDVNIKGVTHMIRHLVPAMIEQNSGIIVNLSSGWGRSTSAEVAPYCATKWAIEGLTQAMADELPGGMAAVPLNPGIINTEMLQSCFGSSASSFPDPAAWAKRAVPFLLQLGPQDNGESLTVPGS